MFRKVMTVSLFAVCVGALGACSDNQGINSATGGLAGAAVGSQIGSGSGRTTAILAGAAAGTAIGANQPTNRVCTYRRTDGTIYEAPC